MGRQSSEPQGRVSFIYNQNEKFFFFEEEEEIKIMKISFYKFSIKSNLS